MMDATKDISDYNGRAPFSPRHWSWRRATQLVLVFISGSAIFHSFVLQKPYPASTILSTSPHCSHLSPIESQEFHRRLIDLTSTLVQLNATAYIAEPGANAGYFGNISSTLWYLSERPLLFVVTPSFDNTNNPSTTPSPKVTILTPMFEATRAKMLPIPILPENTNNNLTVEFIQWAEDANPYATLASSIEHLPGNDMAPKIFVDPSIRHFIVDGLRAAFNDPATTVSSAPQEINMLRERKSRKEIELMKCANEAVILSIRSVRQRIHLGMKESQVRKMMSEQLASEGLSDAGCLTLFGENAALPHGKGTDRILGSSDLILLDCTGTLHGYNADVTRTFALDSSRTIPMNHLKLWNYVHQAQEKAFLKAKEGVPCSDVDNEARNFLEDLGYGKYFTHRLGHGIGLEGHEAPYLRGGSNDIIQSGHAFSDEPGIYIEGQVGIRLEDCFYIDEAGHSVYLTEGTGGPARTPWYP